MAICPRCGSDKYHYQLRSVGSRGHANYYRYFKTSFIIPTGTKDYSSENNLQSIGFCPDCGYVQMPEEPKSSISPVLWIIGIVAALYGGLVIAGIVIFFAICGGVLKGMSQGTRHSRHRRF